MGNAAGVPAFPTRSVTSSEAEAERQFRERIGYISIIKKDSKSKSNTASGVGGGVDNKNNNTNNASGSGKKIHEDFDDLVSALEGNIGNSWASSVTSITHSLGGSYLHSSSPKKPLQQRKNTVLTKHIQKMEQHQKARATATAVSTQDFPLKEAFEIQHRPTLSTAQPSFTLISHSSTNSSSQPGESVEQESETEIITNNYKSRGKSSNSSKSSQSSHNSKTMTLTETLTESESNGNSGHDTHVRRNISQSSDQRRIKNITLSSSSSSSISAAASSLAPLLLKQLDPIAAVASHGNSISGISQQESSLRGSTSQKSLRSSVSGVDHTQTNISKSIEENNTAFSTLSSRSSYCSTAVQIKNAELLRDVQRKMDKVDLEQDSCMHQIKTMNSEMASHRRDGIRKLQDKDNTIDLHKTEIAFLKQQMLQLRMEHEDHKSVVKTETRNLVRKMTTLKNQLTITELEKDSAVAAALAVTEAAASASNQGSTVDAETHNRILAQNGELRGTVQDLLHQLESSEDAHQLLQDSLQKEVLSTRKKLERLESEHIVVEREREDAKHKIAICQQHLDLERALNSSSEKHYQEEISKWKDLYEQNTRFTQENHKESTNQLQKIAVTLGSKLGAGILEGIDEEGCHTSQATTASMNSSSHDDDCDAYYANLVGTIPSSRSATAALSNDCSSRGVTAPMVEITATYESMPAYVVSNNDGGQSQSGFQETISIPSFLSKVW